LPSSPSPADRAGTRPAQRASQMQLCRDSELR
jgi:hypothetical protein